MTLTLLPNGTVLTRVKNKSAMDVAGRLHRSPGAPLLPSGFADPLLIQLHRFSRSCFVAILCPHVRTFLGSAARSRLR
jgi:hypothetical protein